MNYLMIDGKQIKLSEETVKNLEKSIKELQFPKTVDIVQTHIGVMSNLENYAPICIKAKSGSAVTHDGIKCCHRHTVSEVKKIVKTLNDMIAFVEENKNV